MSYNNIKNIVKSTNSLQIYDMVFAGEGLKGLFGICSLLGFLEKHIRNDTYHPYLFRYLVCSSVGSIAVSLLLRTRFLYETQSKEIALEYLKELYNFLSFDNLRNIFFDTNVNQPLNFFNSFNILQNFLTKSSLFSRSSLEQFLQGDYKDFKFNTNNLFTSKTFYDWLNPNIQNVFIATYSATNSISSIFTGNPNRYKEKNTYINYVKLTPENYLKVIDSSSAIPIIYPLQRLDSRNDYVTDGSVFNRNLSHILSSLIYNSEFFTFEELFKDEIKFFDLDLENQNNLFVISCNKLNYQRSYEVNEIYSTSENVLINNFLSVINYIPRLLYYSQNNINDLILSINKPILSAQNDIRTIPDRFLDEILQKINKKENIDSLLQIKDISENIPTIFPIEEDFKNSNTIISKYYKEKYFTYKECFEKYSKYKEIIESQPYTKLLFNFKKYNEELKDNIPIKGKYMVINDLNIRSLYKFDEVEIYSNLLFNNKSSLSKKIDIEKTSGILSANILYDDHTEFQNYNILGTNGNFDYYNKININNQNFFINSSFAFPPKH